MKVNGRVDGALQCRSQESHLAWRSTKGMLNGKMAGTHEYSADQRSVTALLKGSLSLRLKLWAPSTASPFTDGMVLLCRLCVSAVSGGGVLATEA